MALHVVPEPPAQRDVLAGRVVAFGCAGFLLLAGAGFLVLCLAAAGRWP